MAVFGLGCFWGAERKFWELGDGVYVTAVGYAGGRRPTRPTRRSAAAAPGTTKSCSWSIDPKKISYEKLLKTFWENHDPTQGMRQGNDVGTQYRSGIYVSRRSSAPRPRRRRPPTPRRLKPSGMGPITTEIRDAPPFYFAEDYHQQYLAKNPHGYCGLGGTGVSCPIGTGVAA